MRETSIKALTLIKEAGVKFRANRPKGTSNLHPNAKTKNVKLTSNSSTSSPMKPTPSPLAVPQKATNLINQKTPLKFTSNTPATVHRATPPPNPIQGPKLPPATIHGAARPPQAPGYFDRAKQYYNGLADNQKMMAKGVAGLGAAGLAYGMLSGGSKPSNPNLQGY